MLRLTNIFKTFAKGTVNEKTALNGVNLHLEQGDFVTVLGSNGAFLALSACAVAFLVPSSLTFGSMGCPQSIGSIG